MKSKKKIKKKISKLKKQQIGLARYAKDLRTIIGGFSGLDKTKHIQREIDIIEKQIKTLKWVLK